MTLDLTVNELEQEFQSLKEIEIKVKKTQINAHHKSTINEILGFPWPVAVLMVFMVYEGATNLVFNGEYSLIKKTYTKIINKKPVQWYDKGFALIERGKLEEAIKAYDKAIEINPKHALAWYDKGFALYKLGQLEEAIQAYDKAININPEYAFAWNNKGIALSEMGKREEAIEAYDRAIEINPELAWAWNNKGVQLNKLGQLEEAIKCFEKAIRISPEYTAALSNERTTQKELRNRTK
ncbi:tetratricopeptide repeat protein [Candidatus Woesearchaeota archaeon]|nr:tetratricopeptide repeat protein [Candidatus Woesearchaeota archaeon]